MTAYNGTTFTYNGQGQRTSKGSIAFTYNTSGELIKQSNGLEFIYDNSGIAGFIKDSITYLYRKNAQGDVIAILSSSGAILATYTYDAWGNHKVYNPDGATENTSNTFIGNINPIRYRSYYYDTETSLYFLQTRYYDPQIGRFITIDDTSYLAPDTINGLNLYAYCGNNPVMCLMRHKGFHNKINKKQQNKSLVIKSSSRIKTATVIFFCKIIKLR